MPRMPAILTVPALRVDTKELVWGKDRGGGHQDLCPEGRKDLDTDAMNEMNLKWSFIF